MGDRIKYKVSITPRIDDQTYGSEQDVSDFVGSVGVGEITQFVDSQDYDFGLFAFGDLELTMLNKQGKFNDENDSRSIFKFSRDLAKVKVEFSETTVTRDSSGVITGASEVTEITFIGLLNEEATRHNPNDRTVSFRILSSDSVVRQAQVSEGAITNGLLASDAIKTILNVPKITSVLTFLAGNITVDQDFNIDDGTKFDNLTVFDAMQQLLATTNSVMRIDDTLTIFVEPRAVNNALTTIELFGRSEITNSKENIISIESYNTGKHKLFNSVFIGNFEASDSGSITEFGLRQKSFTFDFITNSTTLTTISTRMLNEFRFPRIEMEVRVPTSIVEDAQLLQPVTVDFPLRLVPPEGKFLPVFGQSEYDDSDYQYPLETGDIEISPNIQFKIIEIRHDPGSFESTLKLRQTGKDFDEGFLAA